MGVGDGDGVGVLVGVGVKDGVGVCVGDGVGVGVLKSKIISLCALSESAGIVVCFARLCIRENSATVAILPTIYMNLGFMECIVSESSNCIS